jgi:ribose-phosphate pyrophosphokinase
MAETLNLVNPDDVLSCGYEISRFPDGQQSIRITEKGYSSYNSLADQKTPITIKSRLNTFRDLELIICANQALKEIGVGKVNLYIPYCIGGRSDRKFQEGGVNYIKTVIAPIINLQNFGEVTIMDPHSDVLEACINNFVKVYNFGVAKMALADVIGGEMGTKDNLCLVSPDAGAYKKIFDVATWFGIDKIITATKVRDLKTGKILHTEVPVLDQHNDIKYVIVDDICDGGRTFIEIAKAIKGSRPTAKIYLVVTHGIFSAGFAQLGEYFEKIFTTNSVKDVVKDPEDTDSEIQAKQIVTQLNVF